MIGSQELLLIILVVVLLFGASKLPEFARSFGKASGEYKKARVETENEVRNLEAYLHESDKIKADRKS
ncbi:twin-arginine translocase TatA/TatE family subunit [Candidatus Methanoperedens nitratireducens]|uniref:Sec-independent protein translocase protein TatA n=1 Tax=Candidatus Methanoperedens nitratireducens TaxID=1392998 RepID=A0A284VRW8_9EURY|nr:twin-arginine translocase TatA/TatE family subunit [Candidatus Methanoperedens nitroreducens]SNQ62026.1 Sec-independent protein translocase protein TatA [Candidatus Methanoperedens nitroreducens]